MDWRATSIAIALATAVGMQPTAGLAQGKGETVKIQDYPGIGNLLYRIAIKKGFCEARGIKCELQTIPSGPLGAQGLLAKTIDVGYFPPEVHINAALKGAKLKAIGAGFRSNVFQLVIRNDLSAPNADKAFPAFMADLKGKKIGVPARGSGGEILFVFLAQAAGHKAEDFTFVAVGSPNTSYGALISKQIDASLTFEPSASMCDVLKTCKTIYRASDATAPKEVAATNGGAGFLVMRQEAIETAPHVADAVIAAGKDAEAFMVDAKNFTEVVAIAQTFFKFDFPRGEEVFVASLKLSIPGIGMKIDRPALQQVADNMLATKQIPAPFDTKTLLFAKAP